LRADIRPVPLAEKIAEDFTDFLNTFHSYQEACGFMRGENPESALKALGAEYLSQEMHDVPYYKVIKCPDYAEGVLPGITKTKSKLDKAADKLDLTCPRCNSSDKVKIARTNLLEPIQWYCRCFRCDKSFKPKRRTEASKMAFEVYKSGEITIAEAIQLRDELEEIIDDLAHLNDIAKEEGISDAGQKFLGEAVEERKQRLERIKKVFNEVKITI
jgi:transposase-like protein